MKKTNRADVVESCEILFILIAPVWKHGWIDGLLIASLLSSLIHIVHLMRKNPDFSKHSDI
jgi:hypothetical protein